jgi:hypothetical protein
MNGYELSRQWFNFCFKNPQKVKPNHTALYFFAIEHCNRMGWKQVFGFPTTMAKDAIGIRSYTTYKQTLDDLVEWGFIVMHERSKNQYSSNIIALSNFDKAHNKAHDEALDKALITHASKQQQYNKTIQPTNNKPINGRVRENEYTDDFEQAWEQYGRKGSKKSAYSEWNNLTIDDKTTAMSHIPNYVEANEAEPHYMKDFERYLKHGTYHSTIIERPRKNTFSGLL